MTSDLGSLLIVDDNEENRDLLCRYLERQGYMVTNASGGRQALDLVGPQTFDLVLLDVMMPDIDGLAVLTALRQSFSSAMLPIIMVTANTQSDNVVEALTRGADDYVTKPLDLRAVSARIRHQLWRKQAEEQLQHAKKAAEDASRHKSAFLAAMSHELRTPLTVILGNLPLLSDPMDLPEPEEIVAIVQDLESAGNHLLSVINDLLDLSKVEAGCMTLELQSIEAQAAVDEAADAVQVMASAKGLTIETIVEPVEVYADPLRIRQILLNLLSNAIKFTEEGGITITVARTPGGLAHFEIQDTGCGIAEEDLPRIFETFQQVDGSSTRAVSGTGLGLAITKELTMLHGGHITVKSAVGHGSAFCFAIPLVSENATAPPSPSQIKWLEEKTCEPDVTHPLLLQDWATERSSRVLTEDEIY